ncbi:NGG1p interacting factor 3 [Nadsonia fulvescens var. elongata DSM 6958]|uniref:NGG1p interacting factor 3 n=1 Tax=Nadsonia fulvescens var. elongata DSM 6958 TaxID=857566 RepID=A0A1E3PQ69_9ASCO|nr:NGG1p interacting factor 3 [Nadsonia fulvescens var. elongata DSM 6958]
MSSNIAVKTIVSSIQKFYPKALADSSWDNTGLLLECPLQDSEVNLQTEKLKVLLTIDLTTAVVDEAIKSRASLIMAYHPFIFRGLKSITQGDSQQRSLLRLARAGISVYCPHTAIDAAIGGVNDWLADGVSGGREFESKRSVIQENKPLEGFEGAGMGRLVELKEAISFNDLVSRIKKHLNMQYIQIALAPRHNMPKAMVSSIAMCAGSGASVMSGVDADVHFTGELGHHEALHLIENGKSAIVCGHSNTERGFLSVFRKQLEEELKSVYNKEVEVLCSTADKDPLVTV